MSIERCPKCRKEYETNEANEEIADYLCPHGKKFSRRIRLDDKRPLDLALEKLKLKEIK